MNLSAIRTVLRRRINDVVSEVWDDSALNAVINMAYQRIEIEILKTDPEAFIETATCSVVANQSTYRKPTNSLYEIALLGLDTSTSLYTTRYERKDYNQVFSRSTGATTVYVHLGNYYLISPTPTQSLTAGLEVQHVPALVLSADTDVPVVHLNLHRAIILDADLLLQGETGEGEEAKAVKTQKDRDELLATIPSYYRRSAADPQKVRIDLDKRY